MELIKLSGLNHSNLNHGRFSDISSSDSHGRTFVVRYWVSPLTWEACREPHLRSQSWAHSHRRPNWQTADHNSKGQNGVTITSNRQPPMKLLPTHTHRYSEGDTQWCSTLLSWLNFMAGSFLTEGRAVCLRKVQLPQLRRSGTLPPFTSQPAAPSFPSAFRTPSLSLQCLTHSGTCESRWTHVTNGIITAIH